MKGTCLTTGYVFLLAPFSLTDDNNFFMNFKEEPDESQEQAQWPTCRKATRNKQEKAELETGLGIGALILKAF